MKILSIPIHKPRIRIHTRAVDSKTRITVSLPIPNIVSVGKAAAKIDKHFSTACFSGNNGIFKCHIGWAAVIIHFNIKSFIIDKSGIDKFH